jgi:AraC family transcriptional regulator, transcriptional activator of the genes for pyochelin and ferripyochelin receptors
MAFRLINNDDNSVLHTNTLTEKDFNVPQMQGDWLHMQNEFGEMKFKQWVFDGVRMGYSDWTFNAPVTLNWEGDLDVVTMYYSLKGGATIGGNDGYSFELRNNQQNMYYGSEASGLMKVDDLRIKSFMLQFNKEAFLRIASGGTDALKYFADQVAEGKTTTFANRDIPIDLPEHHAIDAIMNCKFSESLKRIFFLSKAMELLVLQAEAYNRILSKKIAYIRSDYDRDRIFFAREYMMQHIDMPPSIPELSKIAGINEFKLKKGYKEMFGNTIFGHLAEVRLEQSLKALQEGEKNIAEIAFALGYSSVQHFSAAFKKRFGMPPSQAKKTHPKT